MDALLREHHTEFNTKLLRAKVREKKTKKQTDLHTPDNTPNNISAICINWNLYQWKREEKKETS